MNQSRLVIAANRLPVQWDAESQDWIESPGGLVSALAPVLRERDGTWIGWNGDVGGESESFTVDGLHNRPVILSEDEVEDHYYGFCNGTIWPLYHDAIRPPTFHRHWWKPHQAVNYRFAEAVMEVASEGDQIWIHDYQLQLVPGYVRRRLPDARIGFFLHIPFPPPEIFERLPWRTQILEGLLGADYLGFQTRRAALNFAAAARAFGGVRGPAGTMTHLGRQVRAEAVPISIDTERYSSEAATPRTAELAAQLTEDLGNPRAIMLGVDRLDYTKGIDLRLRAMEDLFDRYPEFIGNVSLIQIAVPSREEVDTYVEIRRQVEELVGRINGRFGRAGWTPVHYLYRSLPFDELVGAYAAADVMLVTPLRDGMNLVAKEFIATHIHDTGVLVLSEFAGAAERLDNALLVNPYDLDSLVEVMHRAIKMPVAEQEHRMKRLRRVVSRWDVHDWARHSIEAIGR